MKTILLLDDEFTLLTLLHRVLKRHGYVSLQAPSAEDAIRRFIDAKGQIDLLVADVTLPVSSGIQVALLLRTQFPGLCVILTSGYPAGDWNDRDAADLERLGSDSVMVLHKPFEPRILVNGIRELTGTPFAVAATS